MGTRKLIMLLFTVFLILMFILFGGAILASLFDIDNRSNKSGREMRWRLSSKQYTSIISNRRLGFIQSSEEKGGILKPRDTVIVWAQEFLDDDILYSAVLDNIRAGIRYFYILDVCHADRFKKLLDQLYKDMPQEVRMIEEGIDVIFVRNDLTLNNFVCMAAETDREQMYSSMIFDDRPFAWVKQSPYRARIFVNRAKHLIAATALMQFENAKNGERVSEASPTYSERIFEISDQIMDFSAIVTKSGVTSAKHPNDLHFKISDAIGNTLVSVDAVDGAQNLADRYATLKPKLIVSNKE